MADTTAFEALAEKLPPDQRARFLAMSIQLRNLPPDDELVLAIEALGFTSLILKEIPAEISDVIGKMRSGLSDAQRDGLREDMEEILKQSIDTPSYKDLRETIRLMQEHHGRVRRETDQFTAALSRTRSWLERRNAFLPCIVTGLCAGLACGAILLAAHTRFRPDTPEVPTKVFPPALADGAIDYLEMDVPEYGGRVGVVLVEGEVLSAFKEGAHGVVVVRPKSDP